MENKTIIEDREKTSAYFDTERKKKHRKRKKEHERSRVRKRNEKIIWILILIVFLGSLIRILPRLIKEHTNAPTIKTKKM